MITFLDFFIIFVIITILFMYIKNYYAEVTYIKSKIDNRNYLVRKLPDSQQAADLLAQINIDLQKLVKHLMATYPSDNNIVRLYKNFNPDNISEGSPYSGYTSYSVNKGERIILCIRQNDEKGTFVDKNVAMYVSTHELAHLATESIGHEPEFWTNFKFILQEAVNIGIYTKVDFAKDPQPFCGIKVTSSVI